MKVALVTNYWKNSDGGGIKTYLVNLVQALEEKGIDVSVIFREGNDSKHFHAGMNKIAFIFKCYFYLSKCRPDVIHSHGPWYCLLPGVIYKKIHVCRLVHTFHTEPVNRLPLFAKNFFQTLLNACDCVTFVSKRLQERIVEVDGFSFPTTAITYAGVNAIEISDSEVKSFRKRFGIKDDSVVLVAIGMTALPYKAEGLKLLIRAVQILREIYPNIVLIATREGKYSDVLKAFAHEMGMAEHVIFTGNIDNPFVPLKMCDIYTHITLGDGLPLALLEAMAMGKPSVATPIAGIPEVIENDVNGLLVELDPEKIAEKINFLLQNHDIRDMLSRNACFTVGKKFTWNNSATTFISLYRGEY